MGESLWSIKGASTARAGGAGVKERAGRGGGGWRDVARGVVVEQVL